MRRRRKLSQPCSALKPVLCGLVNQPSACETCSDLSAAAAGYASRGGYRRPWRRRQESRRWRSARLRYVGWEGGAACLPALLFTYWWPQWLASDERAAQKRENISKAAKAKKKSEKCCGEDIISRNISLGRQEGRLAKELRRDGNWLYSRQRNMALRQ